MQASLAKTQRRKARSMLFLCAFASLREDYRVRYTHTPVKRLLKQRHTTQLRVGEVDRSKRLRGFASRLSPHESRSRTNHRVSLTHHVQSFNQPANVRMRACEVAQRNFSPAMPISLQEPRASRARILVTKRIVVSEHSWTTIQPALVRRDDIPERRAFVKHIVPRQGKVTS